MTVPTIGTHIHLTIGLHRWEGGRREERAEFTRRRKEAYEALHPESAHGGDRKSDQVADFATRSFADDQAEKTGKAGCTVRLAAERGEKVTAEASAND